MKKRQRKKRFSKFKKLNTDAQASPDYKWVRYNITDSGHTLVVIHEISRKGEFYEL